jgi:hypothetical protein
MRVLVLVRMTHTPAEASSFLCQTTLPSVQFVATPAGLLGAVQCRRWPDGIGMSRPRTLPVSSVRCGSVRFSSYYCQPVVQFRAPASCPGGVSLLGWSGGVTRFRRLLLFRRVANWSWRNADNVRTGVLVQFFAGGEDDGQEGAGGIPGGGGVPAGDAAAAGVPVQRGAAAGALRLGLLAAERRRRRRVRAARQPAAAALPAAVRVVLPGRGGGPARVAVVRVPAAGAAAGGGVPGPARRDGGARGQPGRWRRDGGGGGHRRRPLLAHARPRRRRQPERARQHPRGLRPRGSAAGRQGQGGHGGGGEEAEEGAHQAQAHARRLRRRCPPPRWRAVVGRIMEME